MENNKIVEVFEGKEIPIYLPNDDLIHYTSLLDYIDRLGSISETQLVRVFSLDKGDKCESCEFFNQSKNIRIRFPFPSLIFKYLLTLVKNKKIIIGLGVSRFNINMIDGIGFGPRLFTAKRSLPKKNSECLYFYFDSYNHRHRVKDSLSYNVCMSMLKSFN